ncbi:MAG: aminotransferase class I/II-fold pyridoxal phosphate-dependent enzyme [Ignavibacteria bacterium]|nr:aminotransferase class I/II-fold pyridoxal phosphate-dependent enzyme [Ignavibacteria bacterium]MBK9227666.1 aminotransferase class I/II-fold pyridoxal phosphate-dependent enzyme [Ignavibacteria bacterium]
MKFDPSTSIHDYLVFGEFGDVNPSITDSSTFTFMSPQKMEELFDHEIEGCFLYSRHWNPINKFLANALARLEDTESAQVTASGMGAISCTVLDICSSGDEIVSSRTVYGGTYALFKNFLPKLGIKVKFVDLKNLEAVKAAITDKTKIIYGEAISNPLLEVTDIPELSKISKQAGAKLIIDNTFSPMIISPKRLGADIVIHSLTKYINGTSDCVAGCICSTNEFINTLTDINSGATMLLGPVLDSYRAASILKNLHSLHVRMKKHSENASFLAEEFQKLGIKVYYPGLKSNKDFELLTNLKNDGFGYGGMMAVDAGDYEKASKLMTRMQEEKVGYLAVSLGYFKTLFSSPGHSTSSEIPEDEQKQMGLSAGLVRFSIGLDNDITIAFERIKKCMKEINLIN